MFQGFSRVGLQTYLLEVAKKQGFAIDEGQLHESLHEGVYYSSQNVRNISVTGRIRHLGKQAVLKVYSDPRMRNDGAAQDYFRYRNKSKKLFVPEVYYYGTESPYQGWLIMEKLPEGSFLKSPLPKEERKNFLKLYLEYKCNCSDPYRLLTLAEISQPAAAFHRFRISRWLELADRAEAELVFKNESSVLNFDEFKKFFRDAMSVIEETFAEYSSMIWCSHSLVRPQKIFRADNGKHYLVDFCRAGMRPLGYELAVIIWGDWLMAADWQMKYSDFKVGANEWIEKIKEDIPREMIYENAFYRIMIAGLTERIVGSILADICANADMEKEEKQARIALLYRYFGTYLFPTWKKM